MRERLLTHFPLVLFLFIAFALEAVPIWALYISGLENVPQFRRTIAVVGSTTLLTIALGVWLYLRITSRLMLETRRLASIVESFDDAIILENLKGEVTDWNQGAERIYGYTRAEAI